MKYALIIGNNKYDDPKLAQLKTPAADSQALAKILGDQTIGSFDEVTPLINKTETQVRRAISVFLTNKKPDDLVLLYFSGHGVLDDRGRLYLALKDTQVNLLKATSIPSSFVADEMDSCRSKRQILILDCCHSGAFARGTKGEQKAITETTFEGSGFGRVVLTASDSTQYALEGDQVIKQTELSLFTHFLLEGLNTGEADTNNDGLIALDEWYDYTYARVISETPRQVPHKWSYNQQGDLIIAKNPYVKKKVAELPYELLHALESSFVGIRESAVNELGNHLRSRDPDMAELAVASLEKMREDDSRRISSLAEKLLAEFEKARAPKEKVIPAGIMPEIKSETVSVASEELSVPAGEIMANESVPVKATVRPIPEKVGRPFESTPLSKESVLKGSFSLKWTGMAVLAIVLSFVLYNYDYSVGVSGAPVLLLLTGIVTGLSGLVQWLVFRSRLNIGWIGANIVAGVVLGVLHNFLFNTTAWGKEHLGILLTAWLISNCILGQSLTRETQETSKNSSSGRSAEMAATSSNPNLFFISLSLVLLIFSLRVFSIALLLTGAADLFTIILGAANIFVGIAFLLTREIPRNFGFIALAISSVLSGIMIELDYFTSDFTLSYFSIPALLFLASGIFFASQRETRTDFRFILLSGFLVTVSVAQITIDSADLSDAFSVIAALFAFPAAIFFLRGK
jgi:uncharacterized caspase-like protein